ncbi:hypothetical protein LCGC14_2550950, partial [marine sediment metagenome]
MKIEWFVQYYYSAEDVYKAKRMQWVVTAISLWLQIILMINNHSNVYMIVYYLLISLMIFGISLWIFRGYEKSKISYRKSMMQCRKEVSEEFKNNWHEFKGSELTWKRDRWIT